MLCIDAALIHAVKQVTEVWLRAGSDCKYITVAVSCFLPWGKIIMAFDSLKLGKYCFGYS